MPNYSLCTPDRVTEVREFLSSEQLDRAIRALHDTLPKMGRDAGAGQHASSIEAAGFEIDFPRIGLDLRVTRHLAQIIVHDPTPEIMDAVADFDNCGRSFRAIYT